MIYLLLILYSSLIYQFFTDLSVNLSDTFMRTYCSYSLFIKCSYANQLSSALSINQSQNLRLEIEKILTKYNNPLTYARSNDCSKQKKQCE